MVNWEQISSRQIQGLLYSYSQIFFARSLWFGVLLLFVSFLNPVIGLSGLLSVIITNILAESFTMNPVSIEEGVFGFCSALVGMGMGAFFQPSPVYFVILILMAALCLFVTVLFQGFLSKYQLPFMGFPFLVTIWILLLSAKYLTFLSPAIHAGADLFNGPFFHLQSLLPFHLPRFVELFCRSLGAVFFQNNSIAGLLIAAGLFLYSRISFLLALVGFATAFIFYHFTGLDTTDLTHFFVGANYIFIAISLGGFFIVANTWSFITVICMVPVTAIVHYGSSDVLKVFHLPAFTLSLAVCTSFFLYLLKWRMNGKYLHQVQLQYSSPEKNLYHYLVTKDNYRFAKYFPISLPFWGEWTVSQGHNGKITHLGQWSKAFDFVIQDEENKTYASPGNSVEDYYCYNKPVLTPGNGTIETVVDAIDDNLIYDVNTRENWGNSVVMNHGNGVYTQLSHLKAGSLKFKNGDYVKRGEIIGLCGNSGRSPEPHIHFQVQMDPKVGAKTFDYPVASYILRKGTEFQLKIFEKPNEGESIRNPEINPLLNNAFAFKPGRNLKWNWNGKTENWIVYTDEWNRITIWCEELKSLARLENDGVVFRFNFFEGKKESFLYQFYLSCYKVFLGYYNDLILEESYPVMFKSNFMVQWIEDLSAPFFSLVKSSYNLKYVFADDFQYTSKMELHSSSVSRISTMTIRKVSFRIYIDKMGFNKIEIIEGDTITTAQCEAQ